MIEKERLEEIKEAIANELGLSEQHLDGTYLYYLTRTKSAFSVGTVTLDDFEEIDGDLLENIFNAIKPFVIEQVKRVQALEKEFELCDSTMHMIDMTINNPSTSDDDKWEKVNKTMKKYYADDCIHCNGKGFNGLDYCPNCIRGEIIQENFRLEQQNKRYREAIKQIRTIPDDVNSDYEYLEHILNVVVKLEESE